MLLWVTATALPRLQDEVKMTVRKVRIIKYHPATAQKKAFCGKPLVREVSGRSIDEILERARDVAEQMNLRVRSVNMALDGAVQVIVWQGKSPTDAKVAPGWRWPRPRNQPGA